MSLSATEISQILAELEPLLAGARLNRSHQPAPDRLVLELKPPGRDKLKLLLAVTPGRTRLHSVEQRPANPAQPMAFQMLLRAHADGDRVTGLRQKQGDRVVTLELSHGQQLVAELTGRHGNVFLLDADGRILGSLLDNRSEIRNLEAGEIWQPPAAEPPAPAPSRFEPGSADAQAMEHYAAAESEAQLEETRNRLAGALRKAIKKARRKHKAIAGDLDRATESEKYLRYGEALKASLHTVASGSASVKLTDYLDEETPIIEVPLKPELSPKQNMERYFRLHRKYQNARARIEQRLRDAGADVDRLRKRLEAVDAAPDLKTLQDIERKLAPGILRRQRPKGRKAGPSRAPAYRTYVSATGRRILVGKNARANDELTFKHARGNDLWMHVKEYPGSHVVIPLERNQTADKETLLDAATLAVAGSRAPEGATVEVAYTAAKHVKKPKGAPAGTVTYRGEKTLYVTADEQRLRRLKAG